MSTSPDRLYSLLPAIYRTRDAEQGYPLRALLRVIAEQVDIVEDDIAGLYNNWFIETCDDWVIPYIGDLFGYLPLQGAGEPHGATSRSEKERRRALIPRRDVANTIRYRRRKGTLALLEELAKDVGGWPAARAVEFYRLLGWTQHLDHLRPARGRTADLRNMHALDHIDDPFDQVAHTVEVRRVTSDRTPGRYNLPSVGVFLWRLRTYPVTWSPAYCLESVAPHCFTFSVLGNDTQLYNLPRPEQDPTHIAREINLPIPISRREFEDRGYVSGENTSACAAETWYGPGKSITIWAPDWPGRRSPQPIPREAIIPADLSGWKFRVPENKIAVDPELGRIMFPSRQVPKGGVEVSYRYAFSDDLGGGEYPRQLVQPDIVALSMIRAEHILKSASFFSRIGNARNSGEPVSLYLLEHLSEATKALLANPASADLMPLLVGDLNRILADDRFYDPERFKGVAIPDEALRLINRNARGPQLIRLNRLLLESAYKENIVQSYTIYRVGRTEPMKHLRSALHRWYDERPCHSAIEITDSGVYVEQVTIDLRAGQSLQLRAASGKRPVIRLLDWHTDQPDSLSIRGGKGSRFILDGLLVTGRGVQILGPDRETGKEGLQKDLCEVVIRHCTLVPGWTLDCECPPCRPTEPSLEIVNTCAEVRIEKSIIGSVQVISDEVKSEPPRIHIRDSIFDATSTGQIALGSPSGMMAHAVLTFVRCTVIGHVLARAIRLAENSIFTSPVQVARTQVGCMRFCSVPPDSRTPRRYECQPDLVMGAASTDDRKEEERRRVEPAFTSTRYGDPGYCQLSRSCAPEIRRGADDLSEMGVFHDLYQPQREDNLRRRFSEYTPAGMEAGIIFVN